MEILTKITDIGNVNDITVTYWEYPYNGFDTLRNKNMQIFSSMLPRSLLIYLRNYKVDSVMLKFFFFCFFFGNCLRLKLPSHS